MRRVVQPRTVPPARIDRRAKKAETKTQGCDVEGTEDRGSERTQHQAGDATDETDPIP
jgi:hypothetical protein